MNKLVCLLLAGVVAMSCARAAFSAEIPANVKSILDEGQTLMQKAEWQAASDKWSGGLQILRESNWDNKTLANLYAKYGEQLVKDQAWSEARPLMLQAAKLYELTETVTPSMASFYANLADSLELGSDPDSTAGEKARRKALALLIFENGATSPAILDQLRLLALNRYVEKDYGDALVLYAYETGLLAIRRPDQATLAGAMDQLGQCAEHQGHVHCAQVIYSQALAYYKKTGKQDLYLAQYLDDAGRALTALGKPEGQKLQQEAVALRSRIKLEQEKQTNRK